MSRFLALGNKLSRELLETQAKPVLVSFFAPVFRPEPERLAAALYLHWRLRARAWKSGKKKLSGSHAALIWLELVPTEELFSKPSPLKGAGAWLDLMNVGHDLGTQDGDMNNACALATIAWEAALDNVTATRKAYQDCVEGKTGALQPTHLSMDDDDLPVPDEDPPYPLPQTPPSGCEDLKAAWDAAWAAYEAAGRAMDTACK